MSKCQDSIVKSSLAAVVMTTAAFSLARAASPPEPSIWTEEQNRVFVETLRDQGQWRLLEHQLARLAPSNSAERLTMQIALAEARFNDFALAWDQRTKAADSILALYDQLVQHHPADWRRPIWRARIRRDSFSKSCCPIATILPIALWNSDDHDSLRN